MLPAPPALAPPSAAPPLALPAAEPPSPLKSKEKLATRLTAAYEHVATLLEEAAGPLAPVRHQLSADQCAALLAQLDTTRAAIETWADLAKKDDVGRPNGHGAL